MPESKKDVVELSELQHKRIERALVSYNRAKQLAQIRAEALDDLCCALAGEGYSLEGDNGELVLIRGKA